MLNRELSTVLLEHQIRTMNNEPPNWLRQLINATPPQVRKDPKSFRRPIVELLNIAPLASQQSYQPEGIHKHETFVYPHVWVKRNSRFQRIIRIDLKGKSLFNLRNSIRLTKELPDQHSSRLVKMNDYMKSKYVGYVPKQSMYPPCGCRNASHISCYGKFELRFADHDQVNDMIAHQYDDLMAKVAQYMHCQTRQSNYTYSGLAKKAKRLFMSEERKWVIENSVVVRFSNGDGAEKINHDNNGPFPVQDTPDSRYAFFKDNIRTKLGEIEKQTCFVVDDLIVFCDGWDLIKLINQFFDFDFLNIPQKLGDRLEAGKPNLTTSNYYGPVFERSLRAISIELCANSDTCLYHRLLKSPEFTRVTTGETHAVLTKLEMSPRQIDLYKAIQEKYCPKQKKCTENDEPKPDLVLLVKQFTNANNVLSSWETYDDLVLELNKDPPISGKGEKGFSVMKQPQALLNIVSSKRAKDRTERRMNLKIFEQAELKIKEILEK